MMKKFYTYMAAVLICVFHLIPFFLLVNLALKTPRDTSSKWITPNYLNLTNFVEVWTQARLGLAIWNNLIITICSVTLVVFVGVLAAYPLARFPTRWNNFIYMLSISILIVPALTILVPLYKFIIDLGGMKSNTPWAIVLIHTTFFLPIVIFLYTGFIRTIPRELDEAALIDGCNRYAIFFRIIFPLLKPVTASVVILTMLSVWNDYQFSLFFLKRDNQTVPLVLSQFFSQHQSNLPLAAAGSLLSMVPMTLVYLFLQKYFISGLAEGAVKG